MLVVSANYSMQSVISGLLFIFLFLFVFLKDKKSQIEDTVDTTEIYKQFRTTFIQYKDSALNRIVSSRLAEEVGDYLPPWWYSPHIGTLFAFGQDPNLDYETEVFETEESVFTVDWFPAKPPVEQQREPHNVIVFLPGLGLTSRNKFAQNFAKTVSDSGYYTAIVNSRGLNMPLKSHSFWHPGQYSDAFHVVEHIHDTYQSPRIFLTGYSAGSNIVQQTLLHSRGHPCAESIRGAMCVCINYDYLASRASLESTLVGSIYSVLMTHGLKDIIRRNAHVHKHLEGGASRLSRLLTSCTFLSDYDRLFAKHLHRFPSQEHLNRALSMHELHRIDVPLLAVQPRDDPLHMGRVRENICLEKVTENAHVVYLEPRHGNHFGFLEGGLSEAFCNATSYTYPARLAVSFFNTVKEHGSSGSDVKLKSM